VITLLVAVKNVSDVILSLIQSLNLQDPACFQVIFKDGGSSDSTLSIIRNNANFVYKIIQGPDCGIYDALNIALTHVVTPYYIVCGADDVFCDDALVTLKTHAEAHQTDIVTAPLQVAGRLVRPSLLPRNAPRSINPWKYISSHSLGALIRVDLHLSYGLYDTAYKLCSDRHFFTKAIAGGATISICPSVVGTYGTDGASSRDVFAHLCEVYAVNKSLGNQHSLSFMLFLCRLAKNYVQGRL
jgi:glycosyltransferase involved in cell wall biosynthesis